MKSLFLIGLLIIGLAPQTSQAMTRCREARSKELIAAHNFSPYPTMIWTSQISSVAAAASLGNHKDEYKKMKTANMVGGVFWLAGSIAMSFEYSCPDNTDVDVSILTPNDIETNNYNRIRTLFYLVHTTNTLTVLVDSSYSSKENKKEIVLAHAVSPFLVDLVNRGIFFRDKLSPYSGPLLNEVLLEPKDGGAVATIGISF